MYRILCENDTAIPVLSQKARILRSMVFWAPEASFWGFPRAFVAISLVFGRFQLLPFFARGLNSFEYKVANTPMAMPGFADATVVVSITIGFVIALLLGGVWTSTCPGRPESVRSLVSALRPLFPAVRLLFRSLGHDGLPSQALLEHPGLRAFIT